MYSEFCDHNVTARLRHDSNINACQHTQTFNITLQHYITLLNQQSNTLTTLRGTRRRSGGRKSPVGPGGKHSLPPRPPRCHKYFKFEAPNAAFWEKNCPCYWCSIMSATITLGFGGICLLCPPPRICHWQLCGHVSLSTSLTSTYIMWVLTALLVHPAETIRYCFQQCVCMFARLLARLWPKPATEIITELSEYICNGSGFTSSSQTGAKSR